MIFPASVTPFAETGDIDFAQVTRLFAWFRSMEADGVVIAGTTGEGPSLSGPEKRDFLRHATRNAHGLKVILGITTNSIVEAKWLSRIAGEEGADAILLMPPSFYRDSGEEGVYAWYSALLASSPTPVIVYNFPKRSGVTLTPDLISRLSVLPNFYGVKDSSGDKSNLSEFPKAAPGKKLFIGDESLLIEALKNGWAGSISGSANVICRWLKAVETDFLIERESAEVKFSLLVRAVVALRNATQPFTNKEILRRQGVLEAPNLRLPLLTVSPATADIAWEETKQFLS